MNEPRQVPIGVFRAVVTHDRRALGVRETVSETGLSGIGTHHRYARLLSIVMVRTLGSHFWFATTKARTWLAITSAVTTNGYQFARLLGVGFHCGFHGMAVFFTGRMPVCENEPHE